MEEVMSEQVIDIIDRGADLLLKRNEALPALLNELESELNLLKCENHKIRDWIIEFGFKDLIENISNSSEDYFRKRFRSEKSLNREERRSLAREVENHSKTCEYCVKLIQEENLLIEEMSKIFTEKETLEEIEQLIIEDKISPESESKVESSSGFHLRTV
jgi:hypothetical protein